MKKIFLLLICILLLTGCKTVKEYIEVPVEVVKTEYRDRTQIDSVYVRDSIFTLIKGDSVFIERNKIFWKEKLVRDTVCRVDSIPKIIKQKEIEVKEVSPWWSKWLFGYFVLSIIWIVIYIKIKH